MHDTIQPHHFILTSIVLVSQQTLTLLILSNPQSNHLQFFSQLNLSTIIRFLDQVIMSASSSAVEIDFFRLEGESSPNKISDRRGKSFFDIG